MRTPRWVPWVYAGPAVVVMAVACLYPLLSALQLVSALTGIVEAFKTDVPNDPTHLWTALQVTDLAGIVSMLYGMLLHQVLE